MIPPKKNSCHFSIQIPFGRKDKREEEWTPVFTGERRDCGGKKRLRGKGLIQGKENVWGKNQETTLFYF